MKVSGFVVSNGAAINVDIGFIPDYVELYNFDADATANLGLKWFRCLADDPETAAHGRYGVAIADGGDITYAAAAANGIIPYDEGKRLQVLLPDPKTGKLIKVRLGVTADSIIYAVDYNPLTNYNTNGVIRALTVTGTLIRPTVHNGCVYELKYKTAGAAGAEPTWSTVPGEETTDTIGNIWICREENIAKGGGLGFTIGSSLAATADDVIVFKAEKHIRSEDMGDAAIADPVSFT